MTRLVYRIVQRLRDPTRPLSRNRYLATFESPEGGRALSIHRRMASLEAQILEGGEPERIRIERCASDGGVRLELDLPRVRASRTTWLSSEELEILLESPRVGALLRQALASSAS